jgi:hypothetical protein
MITPQDCDLLRRKLNEALTPIAKEFGTAFKVGTIRYGTDNMRTTIELNKVPDGVDPTDKTIPYKADLKKYGFVFGVKEEDAGLKDRDGNTFIGIAPKRSKFPFVFQQPNGKIILFTKTHMDGVKALNKR